MGRWTVAPEPLPVDAAHLGPPTVIAVAVSTADGDDLLIVNLDTATGSDDDHHVERLAAWTARNSMKHARE